MVIVIFIMACFCALYSLFLLFAHGEKVNAHHVVDVTDKKGK